MKAIIGLGNPGKQYERTRHNAGFFVLDLLAEKLNVNFKEEKKFKALVATYKNDGENYLLVKPLTFMNLSGEAVLAICNFYHLGPQDLYIIHDDLDLPVGKLRIRTSGSSGGQKGMKNIMDLIHSQELKRIRVGISNNKQIKDYVLTKINSEEWEAYEASCLKARDALIFAMKNPFEIVMNRYNG